LTNSNEKFICEKCGEIFSSGWALGGHASRVHPGESLSYKKKIQRRQEREIERELLRLAKAKHKQIFGEHAPINRVKIRKFKREFRRALYGISETSEEKQDRLNESLVCHEKRDYKFLM
jgi:recombinational DNA repair protein (RecF pathway)